MALIEHLEREGWQEFLLKGGAMRKLNSALTHADYCTA